MKFKYIFLSVALTLMLSSFFVFAGEGKEEEQEDYVLQNMFFVPFLIYSNAEYGNSLPDGMDVDFKAWNNGSIVVEYDYPLDIEYFNFTTLDQYDNISMSYEDDSYELQVNFRKK